MLDTYDISRIVRPLQDWFVDNARCLPWRAEVGHRANPYYVWISEIMLQQTRVEAVKPYFIRFIGRLPDVASLAECPQEELFKLWEGLGYYNRARNLKAAAVQIMERWGGELPGDYEALRELKGIGPYTAGAIASIAFGQAVPAVDGNVLRVISRITADEGDIAKQSVRKHMEEVLGEMMGRLQAPLSKRYVKGFMQSQTLLWDLKEGKTSGLEEGTVEPGRDLRAESERRKSKEGKTSGLEEGTVEPGRDLRGESETRKSKEGKTSGLEEGTVEPGRDIRAESERRKSKEGQTSGLEEGTVEPGRDIRAESERRKLKEGQTSGLEEGTVEPGRDLRAEAERRKSKEGQTSGLEEGIGEPEDSRFGGALDPGLFNQAMMDLGAMVCLPNGEPLCEICPLESCCLARQEGRERELPVKSRAVKRRIEERTVFVLRAGKRVAIRRRPERGLLGGLYELPNQLGYLEPEEIQRELGSVFPQLLEVRKLPTAKHIFSHVEWRMQGYEIWIEEVGEGERTGRMLESGEEDRINRTFAERDETDRKESHLMAPKTQTHRMEQGEYLFVDVDELREKYAVPAAFGAYMDYLYSR